MPKPFRSFFALIFAGALLTLLVGCAAMGSGSAQQGDGHYIIRLAPAGSAAPRLNHPAQIDSSEIERILAALQFREQGLLARGAPQPVFDREEITRLAPGLARALADATSNQRVEFMSLSGASSSFGNARKTEGALFVDQQGALNLAFSGVRQIMTVDDDFTRFREISLGDPLLVDRALVNLAWERDTFAARRQSDGSPYPLWVMVQASPVRTVTERGPARAAEAPVPVAATPAPQPSMPASPESVTPPPVPAPETSLSPTDHKAVRERLEFLKTLHEDGLISDEDYERERQRALRLLD